jgi:hypothetical protein
MMTPKEREVFSQLVGACEAIGRDWEKNLTHAAGLCASAAEAGREILERKTPDVELAQLVLNAAPNIFLAIEEAEESAAHWSDCSDGKEKADAESRIESINHARNRMVVIREAARKILGAS